MDDSRQVGLYGIGKPRTIVEKLMEFTKATPTQTTMIEKKKNTNKTDTISQLECVIFFFGGSKRDSSSIFTPKTRPFDAFRQHV